MIKDLCFEIIQACPNNCLFCSSCSSIDKEKIIDLEVFKKTIDYLMDKGGIEEISLSGGEPFLHPELFKMITYCKSLGIRVVLFTSGVKIREKIEINTENQYEQRILEEMNAQPFSGISKQEMQMLKEIGLDKIVFDFQGASMNTYNTLMGTKNQFSYVADSMLRASFAGLDVDVHFIPLKNNYQEFKDILELLEIAEIHHISLLNFVPQGRGEINQNQIMLSNKEMQEFIKFYHEVKGKFDISIRIGIPLLGQDKHLCTAGMDKLVIKYDGTVLPCPAFKEYDLVMLHKIGIQTPNIYTNLKDISIRNGTRKKPLCKQLYHFVKGNIE